LRFGCGGGAVAGHELSARLARRRHRPHSSNVYIKAGRNLEVHLLLESEQPDSVTTLETVMFLDLVVLLSNYINRGMSKYSKVAPARIVVVNQGNS
jgi:hypothetical protein